MEIVSTAVYVGPNVYAKLPLIRLTVDLHRRAETSGRATTPTTLAPLFRRSSPASPTPRTEDGRPLLRAAAASRTAGSAS